jgi:hypothetical protein
VSQDFELIPIFVSNLLNLFEAMLGKIGVLFALMAEANMVYIQSFRIYNEAG